MIEGAKPKDRRTVEPKDRRATGQGPKEDGKLTKPLLWKDQERKQRSWHRMQRPLKRLPTRAARHTRIYGLRLPYVGYGYCTVSPLAG